MLYRLFSKATLSVSLLLVFTSAAWASPRSELEADVIEWAGQGPHTAYVFVDFDLSTVTSGEFVFGVRFSSPTITGEEAINIVSAETGLIVNATIWPGMGMAVDEMVYVHDNVEYRAGYDLTWTNWWNYWPSGDLGQTWDYSLEGASTRILRPGDTDGWIFANGSSGPNGPRFVPETPTESCMVRYKNCNPTVDGTNLFIENATKKSSLKIVPITSRKGPMHEKKNTLYIANCDMIQNITVSGSLGKVYSAVPVKSLSVTGTLRSLTTKDALVEWIDAGNLRRVKMAAPLIPIIDSCTIQSTGTGKASLSLMGGILSNLNAPEQNFSSIVVSSKKMRGRETGESEVAKAGVSGGEIIVGSLGRMSGKDATIRPTMLRVNSGTGSTRFSVALGPVAFSSGAEFIAFSGAFDVSAQKVFVTATGGELGMESLLVTGEITRLAAKEVRFRMGRESISLGGYIRNDFGNPSAPIALFISGTNPDSPRKDIRSVYAARGLLGHFVAGATLQSAPAAPILPSLEGRVRSIATSKARKGETPPAIMGASWSNTLVSFKGGNHDGFVENTTPAPLP